MPYSKPFPLTDAAIDNVVPKGSPGTYLVGRMNATGEFVYVKVGRDDVCVNTRLHSYVNNAEFAKWQFFKFHLFATPSEAFEEESRVFHKDRGPKNEIHPARPDGDNYHCPVDKGCFPDADDDDEG